LAREAQKRETGGIESEGGSQVDLDTRVLINACIPLPKVYDASAADLCSDLVPKITCKVEEPGLISRYASNTLLVPSRLAFLQRSASGTVCLRLS